MAEDIVNAVDEHMLTTIDNPYNPFTQFDAWYVYDTDKGYNTCALLARITKSSDELSDYDQALAIELAMHEIIKENVTGLFKLITKTK